jgi:hypothetical protein
MGLPRDLTRRPPDDLPRALLDHFRNGVVYLSTPKEEKDEAKKLGARWDWEIKRWWVPPELDWKLFRRWLPPDETSRRPVPPGKLARYYLSVLEHAGPDDMGANKPAVEGVTFDQLDRGRLDTRLPEFERLWVEAREKHRASPSPLEPLSPRDGQPEAVGILLAFGFRSGRSEAKGVVVLFPALLEHSGTLG